MMRFYSTVAHHERVLVQALYLFGIALVIAFVFMKFQPDVGIGPAKLLDSALTDYAGFEATLLDSKAGNHAARFLGNRIVYHGAKLLETATGVPADPRWHPLRVSATIFAIFSVLAGIAAARRDDSDSPVDWRRYAVAYGFVGTLSLYAYQPYDLPAFACIAIFMFLVLRRRFLGAWFALIACGLFRENGLHAVYIAATLLVLAPPRISASWVWFYGATWLAEYIAVRAVYGFSGRTFYFTEILREFSSPTLYASVAMLLVLAGLAAIPVARRAHAGRGAPLDRFIAIHILSIPLWILFYRIMGGNIAEFRMLLPVALPLVFGIAYRPQPQG